MLNKLFNGLARSMDCVFGKPMLASVNCPSNKIYNRVHSIKICHNLVFIRFSLLVYVRNTEIIKFYTACTYSLLFQIQVKRETSNSRLNLFMSEIRNDKVIYGSPNKIMYMFMW